MVTVVAAALMLAPQASVRVPIRNWTPTKLEKHLNDFNLYYWVEDRFKWKDWPFLGDPLPTVTLLADDERREIRLTGSSAEVALAKSRLENVDDSGRARFEFDVEDVRTKDGKRTFGKLRAGPLVSSGMHSYVESFDVRCLLQHDGGVFALVSVRTGCTVYPTSLTVRPGETIAVSQLGYTRVSGDITLDQLLEAKWTPDRPEESLGEPKDSALRKRYLVLTLRSVEVPRSKVATVQ